MRARVADAIEPVDAVERTQERREGGPRPRAAPVGVDVLAEQRDLAHPVGRQAAHLGDELAERSRDLPPARGGDDAVRADHVAAGRDLHPALKVAGALGREVAGEALELEEALRRDRVAGEELGELVDLAGPEGDVDERELTEDLILD